MILTYPPVIFSGVTEAIRDGPTFDNSGEGQLSAEERRCFWIFRNRPPIRRQLFAFGIQTVNATRDLADNIALERRWVTWVICPPDDHGVSCRIYVRDGHVR
jgi:hypothetical protein